MARENQDNKGNDLERSRLVKLFHSLDLNRDGKIDTMELTEGLQRQGYGYVRREQIEVSNDLRFNCRDFVHHVFLRCSYQNC